MKLDSGDFQDLAKLCAMAAVAAALAYAAVARWETRHAVYEGTATAEPAPVTLDAHRRVDRIVMDVRQLMIHVEGYYSMHGRWPRARDVPQTVSNSHPELGLLVKEYALGSDGRLRVTLAGSGLEGRRIVLTPRASSRTDFEWTCAGPAAWRDWLSPICRSES